MPSSAKKKPSKPVLQRLSIQAGKVRRKIGYRQTGLNRWLAKVSQSLGDHRSAAYWKQSAREKGSAFRRQTEFNALAKIESQTRRRQKMSLMDSVLDLAIDRSLQADARLDLPTLEFLRSALSMGLMAGPRQGPQRMPKSTVRILSSIVGKTRMGTLLSKRITDSQIKYVIAVLSQQRFLTPEEIQKTRKAIQEYAIGDELGNSLISGYYLTRVHEQEPDLTRTMTQNIFRLFGNTPETRTICTEAIDQALKSPETKTVFSIRPRAGKELKGTIQRSGSRWIFSWNR